MRKRGWNNNNGNGFYWIIFCFCESNLRCVLLPTRSPGTERRTRHLTLTSDPEWHQTMVYPDVAPAQLRRHQLEVTVWHHHSDRQPHEFLGEFLLDLAGEITQDLARL